MFTKIEKRDGRIVDYKRNRVADAINRAAIEANELVVTCEVIKYAENILKNEECPSVEAIQDAVCIALSDNEYSKTAKAYREYREMRTKEREKRNSLSRKFREILGSDAIDSDLKRSNANVRTDEPMGAMLALGGEATKEFALRELISPDIAKAHEAGEIYIHDLDFYSLTWNCCQIELAKILKNGFNTGHGWVREPNGIRTAANLACIVLQANQNQQFGGQGICDFEYALAPYVKKTYERFLELLGDEQKAWAMTEDETAQAMEALIHNLNTMHSRAGAQVPFSSINYGTGTTREERLVIKCVLDATWNGLGHGETPIFPVQIFRVQKDKNQLPGTPNYDLYQLACKVTGKRLYPNFSFQDALFNKFYYRDGDPRTYVSLMGCRTRVVGNCCGEEIFAGRGNFSFCTINLPRIALEVSGVKKKNKKLDKFFDILDSRMDLCKKALLERFELIGKKKKKDFSFILGQNIWYTSEKFKSDDTIREMLKQCSLSIGFIGLAECLKSLVGYHHGESKEARELGIEIVHHMFDRCNRYKKDTKLNWSLFATPAEGLSGKFTKKDKEKYGVIDGVTDRDYYTNSSHVPVYYPISIARKIEIEGYYHQFENAGAIGYVELDGNAADNPMAIEKIVNYMGFCGFGYGAINHPVDFDPECGYQGIIGDVCPKCGRRETEDSPFTRVRRITGYLSELQNFNDAKRSEEAQRVKHGQDL